MQTPWRWQSGCQHPAEGDDFLTPETKLNSLMLNIQSSRNDIKRAIDGGGGQGLLLMLLSKLLCQTQCMSWTCVLRCSLIMILFSDDHFFYGGCCEMPSSSAAALLFKQRDSFLLRIFVSNEEHLEWVFKTNRCLETEWNSQPPLLTESGVVWTLPLPTSRVLWTQHRAQHSRPDDSESRSVNSAATPWNPCSVNKA